MKKNINKLIAASLVTTMGLGYINYPVQAQEETEVNVPNTVEDSTGQEQIDIVEESDKETDDTTDVKEPTEDTETVVEEETNTATDEEPVVQTLNEADTHAENNAGSFNVTGGTNGNEWTYDNTANTLTFNQSGDYTITGNGTETQEKIVVRDNFVGTITIKDVNVNVSSQDRTPAFNISRSANLILNVEGVNIFRSGWHRSGITFNNASTGSLLIKSDSGTGKLEAYGIIGAGIGGSNTYSGNNITIESGNIIASGDWQGAGIGGGFGGAGNNIIISGGTVTATTGIGTAIGGGQYGTASNIQITGGSVKAGSIGTTPTDGNGNYVYLAKIDGLSGIDSVTVDGTKTFTRNGNHPDEDGDFYLYLTGEDHTITADGKTYHVHWDSNSNTFKYDNIVPTVTIEDKTATSITVQPLADTDIYGKAEYSINNADWQSSNVFDGLKPGTEYIIYARYKGNDAYFESDVGSIKVATKMDGATLIQNPTGITATYGDTLSDIELPTGWSWAEPNTSVSVGNSAYSARFNTTNYEDDYDFTNIKGYDSQNQYVEVTLTVDVSKADTELVIKTENMDKSYDGKSMEEPEVEIVGNTNSATFKWYKQDGNDWIVLTSAPVDVGMYKVVASVEADNNYKENSIDKEFSISQTTNEWTSELSIADWTYGQTASTPVATAKYGNVVFTYSDKEDGTYTGKVPTEAGTWYVKATVEGNENYTGMVATDSFEISKAQPSFTLPKDLVIKQGDALSTVSLPDGFTWVDDTQTADVLGTQPFKAVFTPEDETNYQTVEVDITVEVVPAVSVINKAPKITAEDKTLTVGDTFDAMKGVTATDAEDGDLTDKIVITKNTVDTSKAGKYTVVYEVTDSHGIRVVRTIYVTVQQKTADTNKKDSKKDTAQTSTQTNVMAWTVLGIVSLGALLVTLFKRKHQ